MNKDETSEINMICKIIYKQNAVCSNIEKVTIKTNITITLKCF